MRKESTNDELDSNTTDTSPAVDQVHTSRRSFLAGGSALATGISNLNLANSVLPEDILARVPDEPAKNGKVRTFTVHAISVDIPYNRFGLHQPKGVMYVLDEDLEAAREASGTFPDEGFEAADDDDERFDFYSSVRREKKDRKGKKHKKGAHNNKKDRCADTDEVECDFDITHGEDRCEDDNHEDVPTSVLRPLVIRANEGDLVEIEFINHLDRHASIHQTSLPYNVKDSDGAKVGFNPDTTVAPGDSITYRWFASHQGGHFFYDLANPAMDSAAEPPQKANLLSKGLFGTLVVEPEGATWTDPFTGKELRSGIQADIHDPEFMGTSYREIVAHYHTPEGMDPDLTFPESDTEQTVHAINYRADSTGQRADPDLPETPDLDTALLEEFFYNSWVNGDPGGGDNMYPVYKGDPMKFVAVGASTEENHVHHLHAHRWKTIPGRTDSDTIDSQTLGLGATYPVFFVAGHGEAQGSEASGPIETVRPDMTFEEAFEIGAGGAHGTAGDNIFHCHLFPHYGEGMWAGFRIFDKEQCGLKPLPNTTIANKPVPDEVPFREGILPDDSPIPGFPDFVPAEVGSPPPDSPQTTGPNPPVTGRQPTPEEKQALGDIQPGAPYADPCDPFIDNTAFGGPPAGKDAPVKEYTIVVLPADIVYNDNGDHDPEGIIYVLEEDADAIRNGELNPEPLFIRANVGDCVEITVKNETERPVSIHPHFVSFDLLGSDSLAMGFNYDQDTEPGQQRTYRWYADEEGPIYFHDHIFGIDDAMHGEFCALIVEPEGSEYLDPYSGSPIKSGSQAIIKRPEGQNDFREFCLHYQDFAQLVNRKGEFINNEEEHNENGGTMAINLRNTPVYQRGDPDPAYSFSSAVHGDPATPVLEAYSNDPIRIRLIQGVWEEQHNFQLHGRFFETEGLAVEDTVSNIIGTSEQFTFFIDPPHMDDDTDFKRMNNPFGLPVQDYLYGSAVVDDLWTGMWGIHRVFDAKTPHLKPLPDRGPPKGDPITKTDLRRMGHFAPFLGFKRLKRLGYEAKLLYDENDEQVFPPDKNARQNKNVGTKPPKAPDPGDPCSDNAPVRQVNVTAFQTEIEFNGYGDHDPCGIIFALDEHVEDIKCGDRPAEPLIIRANEGDCLEINLTNELPCELDADHAHPLMRIERPWEPSNRISLHALHTDYDVNGSDGATVGFNFDQTIAPGETITYRWSPHQDHPFVALWDTADIRSHRHHGAFGGLVVTPPDTTWLDPVTAEPLPAGDSTMLKNPHGADRREFTLQMSDARYIINRDYPDNCVVPPGPDTENADAPCNQIGDREDQGYPAINNRSEPFIRRFQTGPDDQHLVFDSESHGDPATPLPKALVGDDVRFLVGKMADKARGLSFHLSEHQWRRFTQVADSPIIGVDDRFTVGSADQLDMVSGAGGLAECPGDFLYGELKERRRLEGGFWGIFRVGRNPDEFATPIQPLPENAPKADLRPADRLGWNVASGDLTETGTTDLVVGVPESTIGGPNAGAVYIFMNTPEQKTITDLSTADIALYGETVGAHAGTDVTVKPATNTAPPTLVVDTDTDTTHRISGGKSFQQQLHNSTSTNLDTLLNNTTNNSIKTVAHLQETSNQ
ncbi:multicopper oxidase domain-containing protein [Halocatena pleomorpha]|uniref:Plastocyanin-like domain-containing protein n=1 Tax=Halocatena pleomorpha TaxID=1785090 RepID=A0A3P3R9Y2_9EURY|nr:multicopper oxidase domain-containing protein [Halocatena pleomorpha]RRJ29490.1 hypothetical protein EIK79_12685 [Halocatena pleomorpha]